MSNSGQQRNSEHGYPGAEPVDIPTFAAGFTAAGASAHFVQHISNVAQDCRDGVFAGPTTSSR